MNASKVKTLISKKTGIPRRDLGVYKLASSAQRNRCQGQKIMKVDHGFYAVVGMGTAAEMTRHGYDYAYDL